MGKCRQGYVQGWAFGKHARCEKSLYRKVSERPNTQVMKMSKFKVQMKPQCQMKEDFDL
jgi:hypothetical protein